MPVTVLNVDLGKNTCSLVDMDQTGHVVLQRHLRRDNVVSFAS
ncbi:hypothetical protein [Methylobacterium nodulans]|nr:hypothetical protein [Methylobacterium nodulans]